MTKKLLIIDDEVELLDILKYIFQENGWSVEIAMNGKEALSKVSSFIPDVILSDVRMPEMTGIEFLESLDKMNSDIPVIFLTGFTEISIMQKAWSLCAFDFLDKPFNEKTLLIVTDNALNHGRAYVNAARKRYLNLKRSEKN